MKKSLYYASLAAMAMLTAACGGNKQVKVEVQNPLDFDRTEVAQIDAADLSATLGQGPWRVLDAQGNEVPSQLTYDSQLIFLADVAANGESVYYVEAAAPAPCDTVAVGRVYPERLDDLAWENDQAGFRAYGPALQARGERGYGYDLFLKRGTTAPVLEEMYRLEEQPGWWDEYNNYKREGMKEQADSVFAAHSYHVDSGYGMDCFAVGPTLGGGITALVSEQGIVYPWCYSQAEVLDNGPLRFTAQLTFVPTQFGTDSVTEVRLITLDATEHLNKTAVRFDGIGAPATIVSGVPLRNDENPYTIAADRRYISYHSPTIQANSERNDDNGNLYLGLAFVAQPDSAAVRDDNGQRHLVAYNTYAPGQEFVYYWGFGWDRNGVESLDAWNQLMDQKAQRVTSPLQLTLTPME